MVRGFCWPIRQTRYVKGRGVYQFETGADKDSESVAFMEKRRLGGGGWNEVGRLVLDPRICPPSTIGQLWP